MVVLPLKSLQGSSFSELFVPFRSSRPHSLMRPADAGQVEDQLWAGKVGGAREMTTDFMPALKR
jgi:hypothetical protein